MIDYLVNHGDKLAAAFLEHLWLVAVTMVCSLAVAAVLTILSIYIPFLGEVLVQLFSLFYSIPSLALFALLIPVTGLGEKTAIIVLTGYNQYLLLRNFLTGLWGIEESIVEAAAGLGFTVWQTFVKIRLPLAKKPLLVGIQLAVISTVSMGTIAAMINAGGLGTLLFDGLRTLNIYKILWGSILSAVLALGLNGIFRKIDR